MNLSEIISEENIKKILNDFSKQENKSNRTFEKIQPEKLAGMIDHTLLKPEANKGELKQLCDEAIQYNFASVCVNPVNVELCFELVKSSKVKVCTVIGFPLGANTIETKLREAEESIKNGAEELDMVINVGRLKDKDYEFVFNDLKAVATTAKRNYCISKVILETCLLTDEEKIVACLIAKEAGIDFVKTSTGFSKVGATVYDVSLMKFVVGNNLKVKASGGIRSFEDAAAMINAGAERLGASAGVKIIAGQKSESNY